MGEVNANGPIDLFSPSTVDVDLGGLRKPPHLRLVTDDDLPAVDPCDQCSHLRRERERGESLRRSLSLGLRHVLDGIRTFDDIG